LHIKYPNIGFGDTASDVLRASGGCNKIYGNYLDCYAKIREREYYDQNFLQQPNMSHMLRWILESWATPIRQNEKNATNNRDGKKHLDSVEPVDLGTIGGIPFKF
jgi:hypothetical protein